MTSKYFRIKVIKGRNLTAKDKTGFSDPYLTILVGSKKRKTKIIYQNLNPEWNELFDFNDIDDKSKIECILKDWDRVGKDFMGEFTLTGADIKAASTAPVEKWFPLQKRTPKDEVSGDVLLHYEFVEGPTVVRAVSINSPQTNSTGVVTLSHSSSVSISNVVSLPNTVNLTRTTVTLPTSKTVLQGSKFSLEELTTIQGLQTLPKDRYLSQHLLESIKKKALVKFDFELQDVGDLPIKVGEIVDIYTQDGDWCEGKKPDGTRGWFPVSYVLII